MFDPYITTCGTTLVWQAWNVPDMAWDSSRVQRITFDGEVRDEFRGTGAILQTRNMPDGSGVWVRDDTGWLNLWHDEAPLVSEPFEQEHLGGAAGGLPQVEAGRQHAGGVDHQQVSGADQPRQVRDRAVLGRPPGAGVDQQPGARARLDRVLGDGPGGQVVVEAGGLHGPHDAIGPAGPECRAPQAGGGTGAGVGASALGVTATGVADGS